MRQIILDTETTGLSAEGGDRIVEIGCIELENRKPTGRTLHFYVNPERDSDEGALKVHGISNEFLRDKPKFAEIVEDFLEFVHGAELIIHNATFDMGFLEMECRKALKPRLLGQVAGVVDTLALAKQLFPGKRNSLDALCDRLEVDNSSRTLHGALLDAQLLAEVYINMTRGQDALLSDEPVAAGGQHAINSPRDYSQYQLATSLVSETERAAHIAVLADIGKKNAPIWTAH